MHRNAFIVIFILTSAVALLSSCTSAETDAQNARTGLSQEQQQALLFEDWVVSQLDTAQYAIAWRSANQPPTSTDATRPDMDVVQRTDASEFSFALECLWQQEVPLGKELVAQAELKRLRAYVAERGQQVFVVMGVGGAPDAPAELYIAPVGAPESDAASTLEWERYRQGVGKGGFHYDAFDQTLTY